MCDEVTSYESPLLFANLVFTSYESALLFANLVFTSYESPLLFANLVLLSQCQIYCQDISKHDCAHLHRAKH